MRKQAAGVENEGGLSMKEKGEGEGSENTQLLPSDAEHDDQLYSEEEGEGEGEGSENTQSLPSDAEHDDQLYSEEEGDDDDDDDGSSSSSQAISCIKQILKNAIKRHNGPLNPKFSTPLEVTKSLLVALEVLRKQYPDTADRILCQCSRNGKGEKCLSPLTVTTGSKYLLSPDRKDNNEGYVPDNVQWVASAHNVQIRNEEGKKSS